MFDLKPYTREMHSDVITFLTECFPESGKPFDYNGIHSFYRNIDTYFERFWCLYDDGVLIGTSAVKQLNSKDCELKTLYLYQRYHGRRLGLRLLDTAVNYAASAGYERMYLDTIARSTRAVALYKKAGFMPTERYNDNPRADLFMVLELKKA